MTLRVGTPPAGSDAFAEPLAISGTLGRPSPLSRRMRADPYALSPTFSRHALVGLILAPMWQRSVMGERRSKIAHVEAPAAGRVLYEVGTRLRAEQACPAHEVHSV
jgi:hypothetical protein